MLAALVAAMMPAGFAVGAAGAERPRLVLWITVDQLRADLLERTLDRFDPGGFRLLADQGLVYTDACFRHASTATGVGHAVLFTGGNAMQHGIVGNEWFDRRLGRMVYCVQDERYPLVGGQAPSPQGRSPAYLSCTTIGDELILASAGRARVLAVSGKDRAAVIPAGRLGRAWWFDVRQGRFVTSTWYTDGYPEPVRHFHASGAADRWRGQSWTLLHPQDRYVFFARDDRPCEKPPGTLGRTFPHPLGQDPAACAAALPYTPFMDQLTAEFAVELAAAEGLGDDDVPDLLSVSFSATDYVQHAFGPDSLEAEDNLFRLDRTLAGLLDRLLGRVGPDRVLLILSADHGSTESPDCRGLSRGQEPTDPGRLASTLNDALRARLGLKEGKPLAAFSPPNLYLDGTLVASAGVSPGEAERMLAEEAMRLPQVPLAVTASDLRLGRLPDDPVARRLAAAWHPQRSGDVLILTVPADEGEAGTHGSPHVHDTHVPILIAGPGIPAGRVHRPVCPGDLAPTVATILRVARPSGSTGTLLVEALETAARHP